MYGRAVEVEPSSAHYYANLIPLLYDIGEVDSSRVVLDRFAERFPDHPNVIRFKAEFAYSEWGRGGGGGGARAHAGE